MSNHKGNIKHGGCGTLTYARWKSMMARCYNKGASNFKYYGAKGISVCTQWHNYREFLRNMGECPSRDMTVERVDNELGYSPDNCIWMSKANQNKHRSYCVQLTYNGRTMNITEWAKEIGMSANALTSRIRLGWDTKRALTQPLKKRTAK